MQLHLQIDEQTSIVQQAQRQLDVPLDSTGSEHALCFPSTFGSGHLHHIRLRHGFGLTVVDVVPHNDVELVWQVQQHRPSIGLDFCVAGATTTTIHGMPRAYSVRGGQLSCGYFCPDVLHGTTHLRGKQRFCSVEFQLCPTTTTQLAESLASVFGPSSLDKWSNEAQPQQTTITPLMQAALQQVLACPLVGGARRLYLEGKALELVALYAANAAHPAAQNAPTHRLRPDDVERIHAARDLLLARLDQPPTLHELARQVYLNEFKLKQGFKQVFGTTTFGYLHQARMERARALLRDGRLNVAEVAAEVGYACPSRFAAAYKRAYGILPSATRNAAHP
jgi:AraC family transcriptional regulator, transcriptional activator of the genes for pyochelin and ferripyochelin receptors